jgi:two-component system phosphate regulon sensor histidine kinase PhoR
MAEGTESGALPLLLERWRSVLFDRLGLLVSIFVVFVALMILGYIEVLPALAGFAIVVALALIVPGAAEIANPSAHSVVSGVGVDETAVRLVADALPDPCLILDRRSNIIHRNGPAKLHFPSLLEGNPIAFSMRSPAMLSAIEAVRRTGAPQAVELHQTVPNETWYKVAVAQLGNAEGLLVVTLQSLTDQRRLDSMRTDFIANVSHELRTPLTSLIGFIDTMLGPAAKDAAAKEKFLGIMRSQAGRMSKLIDDLLSLSRIEMRQHVRPTTRLDLATLLREVKEGLQMQAAEANVTVNLVFPETGAQTTGDHDELYEVFENVLENAVKYGGDGGKVEVALTPVIDRTAFGWQVTVTDYGMGIDPMHVPRLTERFYRVDAESSRQKKGTGLGLAIVKHIVARHHGALSIRSQPGQGTRVEVLLPR